jgi:hypothetical protein
MRLHLIVCLLASRQLPSSAMLHCGVAAASKRHSKQIPAPPALSRKPFLFKYLQEIRTVLRNFYMSLATLRP